MEITGVESAFSKDLKNGFNDYNETPKNKEPKKTKNKKQNRMLIIKISVFFFSFRMNC